MIRRDMSSTSAGGGEIRQWKQLQFSPSGSHSGIRRKQGPKGPKMRRHAQTKLVEARV